VRSAICRPHCYATLLGLLACTELQICGALALTCEDVGHADGVFTICTGNAAALYRGGRAVAAPSACMTAARRGVRIIQT
jgi:hypothetical protein